MQPETLCAICERDINSLSPKAENMEREISLMRSEGQIGEDVKVTSEITVELEDGRIAHERCKGVFDFLNVLGVSPEITEKRLKGYRAGFDTYMNPPYGNDSPAHNSYRVLQTAYVTMCVIEAIWQKGSILPGECFTYNVTRKVLLVQDVTIQESAIARNFANNAQVALCHAIILWSNAHKSKQQYKDDQEMFLEENMYNETLKSEVEHFVKKRNKAIGHISTNNWDKATDKPYQPYPDWSTDWKRFKALLLESINICQREIPELEHIGPGPTGDSFDPIRPGVDLMNALGMPTLMGTGPRPPLQGPYPFKFGGTNWVECSKN